LPQNIQDSARKASTVIKTRDCSEVQCREDEEEKRNDKMMEITPWNKY